MSKEGRKSRTYQGNNRNIGPLIWETVSDSCHQVTH